MQTTTVHKARDLSSDERRAIEKLLGRQLQEDELVQVSAPVEEVGAKPNGGRASLPAWPGRAVGKLRREHIYDELR